MTVKNLVNRSIRLLVCSHRHLYRLLQTNPVANILCLRAIHVRHILITEQAQLQDLFFPAAHINIK